MRTLSLVLLSLGLVGCIPKVAKFDRFVLRPGEADVQWLMVDERLHRCVNLSKGPVCARVAYVKSEAEATDLPGAPPPGTLHGEPPPAAR